MKKFMSAGLKLVVLFALVLQVAFASDAESTTWSYAEPVYLTLCGVMLLVFGMLRTKKTGDEA